MYFGSEEYVNIKKNALAALHDNALILAVISWVYGIRRTFGNE